MRRARDPAPRAPYRPTHRAIRTPCPLAALARSRSLSLAFAPSGSPAGSPSSTRIRPLARAALALVPLGLACRLALGGALAALARPRTMRYARARMHTALVQIAPVLAAAKSKAPFYVAGGVLVAWALILALGVGLRRPEVPGSLPGQRAIMAISAVLVVLTLTMAVATSGGG
jgi:hypothetical protein